MKVDVFDLGLKKIKEIVLPSQFCEEIRPDLIQKAVLTIQSNKRQKYGAKPDAGKVHAVTLSKRRRAYKTVYGHGGSRTPKKTMWHRGRQFGLVGAFAPNTVGGRRAHPPKSEKDFSKKMNKKEMRKAIRSAISYSAQVVGREKLKTKQKLPIIIEDKIEELNKTKELVKLLEGLGLRDYLNQKRKIRAGKGKLRGRKYKNIVGPLIVVSKDCKIKKIKSLNGLDVARVDNLNVELLTPGFLPRLVIWSESAIKRLEEEKLFMLNKPKRVGI